MMASLPCCLLPAAGWRGLWSRLRPAREIRLMMPPRLPAVVRVYTCGNGVRVDLRSHGFRPHNGAAQRGRVRACQRPVGAKIRYALLVIPAFEGDRASGTNPERC